MLVRIMDTRGKMKINGLPIWFWRIWAKLGLLKFWKLKIPGSVSPLIIYCKIYGKKKAWNGGIYYPLVKDKLHPKNEKNEKYMT